MIKRLTAVMLCILSVFVFASPAFAKKEKPDFLLVAEGIINWKKKEVGAHDGNLLCDSYLELAGTTAGDWYTVGLARLGKADNYAGYLAILREKIEERYRQPGKLSAAKATEWHRVILAILASGGDPTAFGTDENGKAINLIADGTYDRGKTTSLGRQGINGWIWGLIALDTMRYEVPEGAFNTREDMIAEILSSQLPDGGWALGGSVSDPDLTAMAVQALAPYYKDEKEYSTLQRHGQEKVGVTVSERVDKALACLSKMQLPTGDFKSWGTENVESVDQVIIALCALGIDPLCDSRFIKNGNTLLDGVLRYRQPDGGFVHSHDFDPDNPAAIPDVSNSMAGEQTLLAMAALWREQNGMRTLYDFRPEDGEIPKEKVYFSEKDKETVNSLPQSLTTEQYVTIITLLEKLKQSEDFENKETYLQKLMAAKEQILKIQAEIDDINAEILEKLYPFETISISDKKTVDSVFARYNALGEYDRTKIDHWEDVIKAKTQIDSLLRALVIGVVLGIAALLLAIFLICRIRKKRGRRAKEMEEFAAQYAEEDEE